MNAQEPMIQLVDIEKRYGDGLPLVLKGINLEIYPKDFLTLMGVSGSGKSTLMNIIGLLDIPSSGHYYIEGMDAATLDDISLSVLRNKKIGFIFQSFYLIPYLTILDNVLLPKFYSGDDMTAGKERAMMLLEKFGMADRYKSKPSELSGGQQQRVAIARAMINEPDLILADEPTGQLDSKTAEITMEYISTLPETGSAVMIVTHDKTTSEYADKIIHIRDGLLDW